MSIYLDNNATTKIDPRVLACMEPYLRNEFGNPSSNHEFGWKSNSAVVKARQQVAQLIQAKTPQITFTSGATESNHLVIQGVILKHLLSDDAGKVHLITSAVEHKCVLEAFKRAEQLGAEITILPVNAYGQVSVEQVEQVMRENTKLVSLIFANNEVGSLNPIKEIGALCRERTVLFHTDAAQAFGKVQIDVEEMKIDFLSISAHKIYGPKGSGALFCREQAQKNLVSLIEGGGQEKGVRAGTLNVAGIVGLGAAAELASKELLEEQARLSELSKKLLESLEAKSDKVRLNGDPKNRLAGNLSLSFLGMDPDLFDTELDGLAFSTSSACGAADMKGSYVLAAIGLNEATSLSTLRLGLGRFTSEQELEQATQALLNLMKEAGLT